MKKYLTYIVSMLLGTCLFGQLPNEGQLNDSSYVLSTIVVGNDTIPIVQLRMADISKGRNRKLERRLKRDARLKRYVIKVYPYAKLAGELFEAYENELDSMSKEDDKKQFMKIAEDELRKEFEGELRKLTIMQGQILVKLVNRETDKTGYQIVKQMRGGLSAFFWQSIARLFGTSLKSKYDQEGDDKKIEEIVMDIENGIIDVPKRKANTLAAQKQLYQDRIAKKKRRKSKSN
ncbi:MAG: hypothetical protein ACJAUV_000670 [Flavobacteriales bacterium]|jgi:hypothetical protein